MNRAPDCNNCARPCGAGISVNPKTFERYVRKSFTCPGRIAPKSSAQLCILALEHPQSLVTVEQFLRNSRPPITLRLHNYI